MTKAAARFNTSAGLSLSGALIYCDGYFLQLLEGEERNVRELFQRICADYRHTDVQELTCQPTISRSFGDWGMSCLHEDSIEQVDHTRLSQLFARVATAALTEELGQDAHHMLKDLGKAIDQQTSVALVPRAARAKMQTG